MSTDRHSRQFGVDRLLYFTDALVAIAATLLVLPLVDDASGYAKQQEALGDGAPWSVADFLGQEFAALLAFAISFAVIARLWFAHHRLFTKVTAADVPLAALNLLWAFTLVFLPLPTQVAAQFNASPGALAFYVGTMLASSLLLTLVVVRVRRHPELRGGRARPLLAPAVATSIMFGVALVVGVAFSVVNYYALLLMLLARPLEHWLEPRLDADDDALPRA